MKRFTFIMVLGLLISTMVQAAPVLDQVVISTGGGQVRNGQLVMNLTIGQPVIGSSTNGAQQLDYGYWWSVLTVNVGVESAVTPSAFAMHTASPNPFSTRTAIDYVIPQGSSVPVSIGIYDLSGRLVRELVRESKSPGRYTATWDGLDDAGAPVIAGVYFAQFHASTFSSTRKVVMLK